MDQNLKQIEPWIGPFFTLKKTIFLKVQRMYLKVWGPIWRFNKNMWLTCEKIRLTFKVFYLFFFSFMVFSNFYFFFFLTLITQRMSITQDINGSYFYYGHALSDCTSGCIVMSSYWTSLEYDDCNVNVHGICWHGIKSS
jgi:hypothetical protein